MEEQIVENLPASSVSGTGERIFQIPTCHSTLAPRTTANARATDRIVPAMIGASTDSRASNGYNVKIFLGQM
jgi:hypothetical protein